ncbi:MAG: MG2 domain-containing protein, partial [Candidatus Binatia bacterium]
MRDWKNLVIVGLGAAVVVLGALLVRERLPQRRQPVGEPTGVPVTVIDVILDRERMASLDVLFDQPLGEKQVGEILGRDPARLKPKIAGSWRWHGANVLRFEAAARFEMATEYEIELRPDRLLEPGQYLAGKTELTFLTDRFQVERVDVYEEPTAEAGKAILRGDFRFNYPVDPKVLATRVKLVDPLLGPQTPVAVHLDAAYWSPSVGFRTDPLEKRKEERTLTLTILSDLTSVQGNVPLPADHLQTIVLGSAERLVVRGVSSTPADPESTIRVRLSAPADPRIAAPYVKVDPEVRFRVSVERDEVVLTGAFEPGESYKVILAEGLPARDGSSLKERFEETVELADLPPSADFESQGMFLSASGYRTLAVKSTNVAELRLVVDRVYRNNIFYLFESYGWSAWRDQYYNDRIQRSLGDRLATETLEVESRKNRSVTTPVSLDRWVKGKEPGLYRVAVSRSADSWGSQRWLLVTDLGIVARAADDELLVWVSSFATLAPVGGVSVRLLSDQNQTIASGRTDAEGIWRLEGLAKLLGEANEEEGKRRPYMITAESGGDFSFLVLERSEIDTAGLDVAGDTVAKRGYGAFLYGERDLYRPGETVEGVAVVRGRKLAPPPVMPAVLRHRDPEGKVRGTQKVETDTNGLAPFTLDVPGYARTGHHTLELVVAEEVIGQYRFQ